MVDKLPPYAPNELLQDINNFSPAEWAHSMGSGSEELQSLAKIYQSATALYCILSLQSAFLFERSAETEAQQFLHTERLLLLTRSFMDSSNLRHAIFWPFTVMGVAVTKRSVADREYINNQLGRLTRLLGQTATVVLKEALRRFWNSGKERWDDCFDRPYCFAV